MSFYKTYEEARQNHKPMRRSGFPKPDREQSQARITLATGKFRSARRRINKLGPRGLEWRQVWQWLKPRLQAAGRTRCEFDFIEHDCWGRLDPCHSKKRREMQGNDIYAVAIGCQNIHAWLDEQCTHEFMEQTVMEAINRHGGMILPSRVL